MEVQVQVEELERGETALSVEVPASVVRETRERVLKEVAQRTSLPGFRKGKAPRSLLSRYLDDEQLREEMLERLLPQACQAALEKTGIQSLERPRVEEPNLTEEDCLLFKAIVTRKPEVKLPEYKGLKLTRARSAVSEEQVEAELERLRARHRRFEPVSDRPAQAGDLAIIDYEPAAEGEVKPEAGTKGYPLVIGSDTLFPQLNEALPGLRPGETKTVPVSYPADYSDPELAGRQVEFRVTLRELRQETLPELNDDFARAAGQCQTLEELRAQLRRSLERFAAAVAEAELRSGAVREVVDGAELELPEALVGREVDLAIDRETERLERQGISLEQHLRQSGSNFERWRRELELEARQRVKEALVLDAIGEQEKIEISQEDLEAEVARVARIEEIGEEQARARVLGSGQLERSVNRIFRQKVVDLLVASAEVTEEKAEGAEQEGPLPGEQGARDADSERD
jgi:trigger factor